MAFFYQTTQSYREQSNLVFSCPLKASISDWDTIAYSSVDVDRESKHPRKAETADSVSKHCLQSHAAIHSIKL